MSEGFASVIAQLEQQRTAIDRALVALREVDGIAALGKPAPTATATPEVPARNGGKRSAAVRKRMKEAQQLRWARLRGESQSASSATPESPRPKRKISPEGIKRIIAATKKRWALKRAQAKAALGNAGAK